MQNPHDNRFLLRRIRATILLFVVLLMLSGITAFPVYTEMKWLMSTGMYAGTGSMDRWMQQVWAGVKAMNDAYPFLFYGYDWMAFAHIIIGLAFIGPYRDPVRNKWIIDWAMIACVAVIPLAVIAGNLRGIPWFHIAIDCAFGVIGIIPLLVLRKWISELEQIE